jgi:hypothetical protein
MITQRQIDANRENARKSTGSTTEEGKIRSRRNAVKHGLAGKGVVLPDDSAQALETRLAEWRVGYAINSPDDQWQFRRMVVNSLRVDQCQAAENALRIHEASRASTCWNVDRQHDVGQIAAGLTKRPGQAVARLRRTRQGCEWLIQQWRDIDMVVASGLTLTEEQEVLFVCLLGVRPEFHLECSPKPNGPNREFAAREIAQLQKLKADGLDELDEMEREMAEIGHPATSSQALERLRRYEAACLREFYRARAELLGKQTQTMAPETVALETASLGPAPCPALVPVPEPLEAPREPEPPLTPPTPEMTASEDKDDEPVQDEATPEQPRQVATNGGHRDAVAARKSRNRRQRRAARKPSRHR